MSRRTAASTAAARSTTGPSPCGDTVAAGADRGRGGVRVNARVAGSTRTDASPVPAGRIGGGWTGRWRSTAAGAGVQVAKARSGTWG